MTAVTRALLSMISVHIHKVEECLPLVVVSLLLLLLLLLLIVFLWLEWISRWLFSQTSSFHLHVCMLCPITQTEMKVMEKQHMLLTLSLLKKKPTNFISELLLFVFSALMPLSSLPSLKSLAFLLFLLLLPLLFSSSPPVFSFVPSSSAPFVCSFRWASELCCVL